MQLFIYSQVNLCPLVLSCQNNLFRVYSDASVVWLCLNSFFLSGSNLCRRLTEVNVQGHLHTHEIIKSQLLNRPLGDSWCPPPLLCFKQAHTVWGLLDYWIYSVSIASIWFLSSACLLIRHDVVLTGHTHLMSVETMLFMWGFLTVCTPIGGYSRTGAITANVTHGRRDIDWDRHSSPAPVTAMHEKKRESVNHRWWYSTLPYKGACVCVRLWV